MARATLVTTSIAEVGLSGAALSRFAGQSGDDGTGFVGTASTSTSTRQRQRELRLHDEE